MVYTILVAKYKEKRGFDSHFESDQCRASMQEAKGTMAFNEGLYPTFHFRNTEQL